MNMKRICENCECLSDLSECHLDPPWCVNADEVPLWLHPYIYHPDVDWCVNFREKIENNG